MQERLHRGLISLDLKILLTVIKRKKKHFLYETYDLNTVEKLVLILIT